MSNAIRGPLSTVVLPEAAATEVTWGDPAGLERLYESPVWTDELVRAAGLRVVDVPFVTIGGGLASFVLVDLLRVCGVPADHIRVVGADQAPYANVAHLMRCSQILDHESLRSDSMSRIDNVWGFPGYALQRAISRRSVRPLWNVLTEPLVTEYFNPSPDEVFRGVDREAARIDWASMITPGWVRTVRRRDVGGYFSLVRPVGGGPPFALCSHYVHLGTGHSAVNYAPEVRAYREQHHEYFRVVNAYEPHEHVYQVLSRRPATVVIRGAGITASRVLQRLFDERARSGRDIQIMHLFRTGADRPDEPRTSRRRGEDGWSYQPFSFPKAAGGGQLRQRMLGMDAQQRADYIRTLGGTTSALRHTWQAQLRQAREAGYYRAYQGELRELTPTAHGTVEARIDVATLPANTRIDVDFVIDCTGLRLSAEENPLLTDLLDTSSASCNPLGGLAVGEHYELSGVSEESGTIYASGGISRGGYLGPVDSFWGVTHAAVQICDDLARRGFCPRLGMIRSVVGWCKWLRGARP
ncbi:MAG TPA: hypothetical protein VFW65_14175 [Pseudonocardiaceae bacterium]|nr:hypothetical protein [Pseudonocardiaceae bacterium]